MSRFILTADGWVNLAHVSAVRTPLLGERERWVHYATGREPKVALWTASDEEVETLADTIIPAATNSFVWTWRLTPRSERPEAIYMLKTSVLVWRMRPDPSPLQPIGHAGTIERWLCVEPDGRLTDHVLAEYSALEEASQALLDRAQREWDQKHGGANAASRDGFS